MAEFLEIVRQVDRMRKKHPGGVEISFFRKFPKGGIRTVNVCTALPEYEDAEMIEKAVLKWAADHPEKTMEDVLFEKFPQAQRLPNGRIRICPHMLNPAWKNDQCVHGESNCRECWRRPVEG